MILYVDLEHPDLATTHPTTYESVLARRLRAKYRFEQLVDDDCLVVHHTRFDAQCLRRLRPRLVVFSGHNTGLERYAREDIARLETFFRATDVPAFTICGSFQLMARAHGAAIGPIGPRAPGDPAVDDPVLPADERSEVGFLPVKFSAHGHAGLPEGVTRTLHQHHFWQVHAPPIGFRVCASSPVTPIQALAHETLPLAGVQAHPEDFDAEHPDGRGLLEHAFAFLLSAH